jgi:hypothetical protein
VEGDAERVLRENVPARTARLLEDAMARLGSLLTLIAGVVLLSIPASAADNGFYLGASVGQAQVDVNDFEDNDFEGEDLGFKVFAGFRFLTFVAVEGGYVDFGAPDDTSADATFEADVTGVDVFAMGMLPLGIADLFVKAGVVDWDTQVSASFDGLSETFSDSGTDPAYGVGFQLRFSSFAVRAEVEYFDIETAKDVYMISVGGSFTF